MYLNDSTSMQSDGVGHLQYERWGELFHIGGGNLAIRKHLNIVECKCQLLVTTCESLKVTGKLLTILYEAIKQ